MEIYSNVSVIEEQLGEMFCCCYRGLLVNMGYIEEYDKEKIVLVNGETLYLSRRKYSEFVNKYLRYLQKGGELLG